MKYAGLVLVLFTMQLAVVGVTEMKGRVQPGQTSRNAQRAQNEQTAAPSTFESSREQTVKIVTQVKRADYEGDRAALKRLYGELAPADADKELGSRVRYWRGFALWRRAINGFNDNTDVKELTDDLKQAWDEFNVSANLDPKFADAKIGALSCVSLLGFSVKEKDPARVQELLTQARQLRKDAAALDPDNPRLALVTGPNLWYAPPERGGGQAKAM
jgi:hypothetical protein